MASTISSTEWVVLATWTEEDGEVRCEVMADGFDSEAEANDAAVDVALSLGRYFEEEQHGFLEVCTREDAADVVTE